MNMLELLRKRRSIRKYQDRPLSADQVIALEEAVLRSPTGRDSRSWEFIFVDDRLLLKKLADTRGSNSAFLAGASLGVVVLGNEVITDTWVEDSSLAAVIVQLAAVQLGLGSCWSQVRNREHSPDRTAEDYVRELLDIPDNLRVLCVIAVGHPAEEKRPTPKKELPFRKIHRNRFSPV
jgi:nitroreductase